MSKILKNFGLVILVFITISAVFALLNPGALQKSNEIALSTLVQKINDGQVSKIDVSGSDLAITFKDASKATSRKEIGISLDETLKNYGANPDIIKQVIVTVIPPKSSFLDWLTPILFILPFVVFGIFFWMILRQSKNGPGQTFNFLRSPAKLFDSNNKTTDRITFKDVAGLEEAKEEVSEIVDFLKNPQKFLDMGAKIPKGVLLIGPPGCGKTLLARAVANEAGVPFYSMSGSEFIELFVGVGASRARSLFETAKKNQPSIVFIDEIDSIGKVRGVGMGGGHEEREQTLNQILAEMDGFEKNTQVIVMAATNRPEYLDPALLRPGRFDRRIILDEPDIKGREEILKIHSKEKPLAPGAALREVAERTPGFSGADLANLMNEAAILATRRAKKQIDQIDILESIEKVLLGPERKSHLLSEKEKKVSAFHEAGHALASAFLPNAEEVRKISIVSRGMAAGYTLALPKEEKRMRTKSEFKDELTVLLAGYTAEQLQFNEISTGASNDLEKASLLARKMVTKYGMSKLGPISFGKRETLEFIGYEQETERNYSDKVAALIDQETEGFIKQAQEAAAKLLKKNKKLLNKVATILMAKETIEKEEFEQLISAKTIKRGGV
ncbi:MAG: ATP-dependent zinc metalloprotease FtsH [Candidatus Pacebacteria bacterium]|nr:ATP-dependent zinc metalloprotease FtsH [Candidatus Paceibacterota bacterium]